MLHFNCILCQIVTRNHQRCYNLLRNISLLCGEIKFQLRFSDSVYRGIFGCYNPSKYFDMQIIRNAGREKIPGQRRRTVRDRGVEPAGTSGLRHFEQEIISSNRKKKNFTLVCITIIQVISVQLGFPQVLIFSFNGILVSILLIVAEKIKQKHGGFLYEAVE